MESGGAAGRGRSALAVGRRGGDDDSGGGAADSSGANKNYKMTLIAGVKGDEFYITMNCGAQERPRRRRHAGLPGTGQFDAALQTPIVNAVAAKKPDAILIAPTDTKALYAPITQAAPTPRSCSSTPRSRTRHGRLADLLRQREGRRDGRLELAKLIGGKGKVMVVNVKPGISTTDARGQGIRGGRQGQPGVNYLGQEYSKDDPAKAAAIVTATLAKHPDLRASSRPTCSPPRARPAAPRPATRRRQDRRLRRRPQAGRGPQGRPRAGPDRPEAGRHRQAGRRAGLNALEGKPTGRRSAPGSRSSPRTTWPRSRTSLQVELLNPS